jgi:hypothetical protein
MNDLVVWLIIAAFYAPLHFLLPILVLFITGRESDAVRSRLMRRALLDSAVSMIAAFVVVIALVRAGWMSSAMAVLLVSMTLPFLRIWRHRRVIRGEA